MWNLVAGAVSGLVGAVMTPVNEWQKRKTIKAKQDFELNKLEHEANIARANASIELAKTGQAQDYDLDKQSQKNMENSWKDEFILIVFILPVILAFVPGYQQTITDGFTAIESMPEWYIAIVIGMVVVIYGLRGLLKSYIERTSKNGIK